MAAALGATCALFTAPAHADVDPGAGNEGSTAKQEGSADGRTLQSRITFSGSTRGRGDSSSKGLRPVGNWTPPPCWYEPMSVSEFATSMEKAYDTVVNDAQQPNYAKAAQ